MTEITIITILTAACIYLLITTAILIRNRFELKPLPSDNKPRDISISILIPARNEVMNIENCVRHACRQNYSNYEVIVLNDRSDDRTGEILEKLKPEFPPLTVIKGKEKPDGWLGKPWACKQLSDAANGKLLVFIDADVTLSKSTLQNVALAFEKYNLEMLTVWPRQTLNTFWEKTLIPMVYYALISILPSVYVYRSPRWMPEFISSRTRKMFAAACGQFISFRRESYKYIGTHEVVKNNIIEDVGLARAAMGFGLKIRMFEGSDQVSCRMYRNESEIRSGFRKNFFAGFSYSYFNFLIAALVHLIVYIVPFIVLPVSVIFGHMLWGMLSFIAIALILIHRLILAAWFKWNPLYSFTHPIGVAWFQFLGILTMIDKLTGREINWKQRSV
jgi:chlorobactene glucosyltransferase